MIAILCAFLIVSAIFVVFGKSFVFYFDKARTAGYSLTDVFFIGLCIVGTVLNIWSLFFPTNQFALIFLIVVSAMLSWLYKKGLSETARRCFLRLKSDKLFTVFIIAALAIVLLFAIETPRLYDAYLYHINSIQWNYLYRTVPGLANLHDRFGFNSSVFVLSAGFSFIDVFGQYLFIINPLCYFVFFVWLLKHILYGNIAFRIFAVLFLFYFSREYVMHISTPGTDLLPNMLVAYVFLTLLTDFDSLLKRTLIFIVLPIFCLTMKLSVMPIVVVVLAAVYLKNKTIPASFRQLVFYSSLLLLPWMIRNVILSGYLIYPLHSLDFFNFDWETSKSSMIEAQNWIYSWARIPLRNYKEVLAMPFNEWFPVWWKDVTPDNRIFFILAAISPVPAGLYACLNRKKTIFPALLTFAICYASALFWFFTAPDFRFSFSFILILALFPLLLFKDIALKLELVSKPIFSICLIYIMFSIGKSSYYLFLEDYPAKKLSSFIYKPIDISGIKVKRSVKFISRNYMTPDHKSIELFAPAIIYTQCYDKFPCTPFLNNIKLRGESLQDGFRSGNPSAD
jgi:hypothetical protein